MKLKLEIYPEYTPGGTILQVTSLVRIVLTKALLSREGRRPVP